MKFTHAATMRNASWVISNMTLIFFIASYTLKEYEIITLIYIRLDWAFNSLSYLTLHDEVCSTKCLNINWSEFGQPDQLMQVKSFIYVFLANLESFLFI